MVTRYWLGKQKVRGSVLQGVKVISFIQNVHFGFGGLMRPPVHLVPLVQSTFVKFRAVNLNTLSTSDEAVNNCRFTSAPPARLQTWTSTKLFVTLLDRRVRTASLTGRKNVW